MSEVLLKSQHLIIPQPIASNLFSDSSHVLVAYSPEKKLLRVAPGAAPDFKAHYKAAAHLLKDRNLNGDKAVALHEIIIDHDLPDNDRALEFEVESELLIIKI